MKNLTIVAFICLLLFSCSRIPIPKDAQRDFLISTACGLLDIGQCYDEPALQAVFSGIDSQTCTSRISNSDILIDPVKLGKIRKPRCGKALKGLGL